MNEDKLIEKARAFAKEGQLQRAKDILEELDSPRARTLLGKVNSAISAKKSEALAQRSQVPETAPKAALPDYSKLSKAKPKQNMNAALVLIALVLICAICWLGFMATSQPSIKMSEAKICVDAMRGMPMGTQCVLHLFPEAMELCYSRVGDVSDTNINDWYDCLETQGVNTNMLDFPD